MKKLFNTEISRTLISVLKFLLITDFLNLYYKTSYQVVLQMNLNDMHFLRKRLAMFA